MPAVPSFRFVNYICECRQDYQSFLTRARLSGLPEQDLSAVRQSLFVGGQAGCIFQGAAQNMRDAISASAANERVATPEAHSRRIF